MLAIFGSALVVLSIGLTALLLSPRTGRLRIEVRGEGASAHSEIFVDGRKVCDMAPCIVADVAPGARNVQVISQSGAIASAIAMVEPGREHAALVLLPPAHPVAGPVAETSTPGSAAAGSTHPSSPALGSSPRQRSPDDSSASHLAARGAPPATGRETRASLPAQSRGSQTDRQRTDAAQAAPSTESGSGTLNANSMPPSMFLVDGRPMGATPKVQIPLPAGAHTVTFVHADLGQKSVKVTIQPGQTAVASVRFKK